MSAPESAVRAVQEALGCYKVSYEPPQWSKPWCEVHEETWTDRGCPAGVATADAAWAAAYPEALRDAAERLTAVATDDAKPMPARVVASTAEKTLRRWADESEAAK